MENINIIIEDMPTTIKAYSVLNSDQTYTIILNARLNQNQQRLSCYHEYKHIINGDYDKKTDVDFIEYDRHK